MSRRIQPRHPEYDLTLTRILHTFESWSGFSFFLMLVVSSLYVVGNLQGFTVETQGLVLQIMQIVGFSSVGINAYALLMIVLWSVRHHHFPLARFVFSVFSLIIGLILSLGASFIGVMLHPDWQG